MTSKIVLPMLVVAVGVSMVVLGRQDCAAEQAKSAAGDTPPEIHETQELNAPDPGELDAFGKSVAFGKTHAIVGALGHAHSGVDSGAAYVYRRVDGGTPFDRLDDTWVLQAELRPSDGESRDLFGFSVALTERRAIVGAKFDDDFGTDSGSAYVYRCDDNGTPGDPSDDLWFEEAKLAAPDLTTDDWFGCSVAIDGAFVLVGAPDNHVTASSGGAVYVFHLDDNDTPSYPTDDTWHYDVKLTPPVSVIRDGFGQGVSLQGVRAVVGASHIYGTLNRAYVWRRDDRGTPSDPSDDVWIYEATLTGSDTGPNDEFGWSVSLWGNRIAVGAWNDDDLGTRSGSSYVFRMDDHDTPWDPSDDTWVQETKLVAWDGQVSGEFGISVSLFEGRLLVGSDGAVGGGAGYIFRLEDNGTPFDATDDSWVPAVKVSASDGGGTLGHSVALRGDHALLGASGRGEPVYGAGAAHAFVAPPEPMDLADFALFQGCMTVDGEEPTPQCARFDFDLDGAVNLLDYGEFYSRWQGP